MARAIAGQGLRLECCFEVLGSGFRLCCLLSCRGSWKTKSTMITELSFGYLTQHGNATQAVARSILLNM